MIANMRLTSSQRRMLLKIIVHLFYRLYPQMTMDAWEESEHKRDKNGKFSATGTGGSSTEENSSEPLKKRAESGIIEEGKKYVLPEKYKTMTDSDVEAYFTDTEGKCILSDSFRKLPLQAKQTIVHGFDTAEKLFGKKIRLQSVTCKKLSNAYGEYDPKKVSITFDPDLCSKEEDSTRPIRTDQRIFTQEQPSEQSLTAAARLWMILWRLLLMQSIRQSPGDIRRIQRV